MFDSKSFHYLTCTIVGILSFFGGFYVSNKIKVEKPESAPPVVASDAKANSNTSDKVVTNVKNIDSVYWVKPGQEPICPQTHSVKGKFDSNINIFYTQSNKNYFRIRPDICFSSEEFAKDQAGFVKKF